MSPVDRMLPDNVLVSVLMPVLSPHPVFFVEAVKSVLRQSHANLELVIVEDPSDSPGRALLAGIEDPRVRHIENPTRTSLVDQRNRALAEARGDLVAMLDADDIAEDDRLSKQIAFLRAHPDVDVVGSQLRIIDHEGNHIAHRAYPTEHDEIVAAMARFNPIAQPSVMCRRSVLLDAGGYQYRKFPVNEDYELWSRLAKRGARLANHPEALIRYRIHPHGTKAAMLRRMLRATIDVKREFWLQEMNVRAKLRFWAEHALLGLPPQWVLKLFVMTQYTNKDRR